MQKDPLDFAAANFFTHALHLHAHSKISKHPKDQYTVQTGIPLPACEPLTGMRSITCYQFTAFSLQFNVMNAPTEFAKFSNGATSVTTTVPLAEKASLYVHAKSPGFAETSSSRIAYDSRIGEHRLHASIDLPSLEDPEPALTLGGVVRIKKDWELIGQLARDDVSVGVKFQPCGHMHAGLGVAFGSAYTVKNLQSSVYAATHAGGSLAVLGTYALNGGLSNLQLMTTTRLNLWSSGTDSPRADGVEVRLPAPRLGFAYDLVNQRTSVFIDMRVSASAPARKSAMNLGVKLGFDVTKFGQPRFTAHINASEDG